MSDTAATFFGDLAGRGYEPILRREKGCVRFELVRAGAADTWLVTIDHGDIGVSRTDGAPTCTVRVDKKLFDRVARGETNAMAAMLRGAMTFEGDPGLLLAFQRLFPGPGGRS